MYAIRSYYDKKNSRGFLGQRFKDCLDRLGKMGSPELGADASHFRVVQRVKTTHVRDHILVFAQKLFNSGLDFGSYLLLRIIILDMQYPVQEIVV